MLELRSIAGAILTYKELVTDFHYLNLIEKLLRGKENVHREDGYLCTTGLLLSFSQVSWGGSRLFQKDAGVGLGSEQLSS